MRLFILCFIVFSLFVRCEKSVSKADLEGSWYIQLGERDDDDIPYLIFEKDSIQLIYENNVSKKGTYNIIDNQLIGCFGIDTFSTTISEFTKDSLYLFDKYYHHDLDGNNIDFYKKISDYEIDFIDLKTNIINPKQFWHFSFYLDKNASDSIKIHDQSLMYEDFIFLQSTANRSKYYFRIFINEGTSINDYKKLMYHIYDTFYSDNIDNYLVTAQSDFNNFHYFKDNFMFWKDDINRWKSNQNSPLPPPPPPTSFQNTKEFYKDALHIKINSSKDLEKLKNLNHEQKTLISYAADLDMKTYIQGQMIVIPLLSKDRSIRTEILGKVD